MNTRNSESSENKYNLFSNLIHNMNNTSKPKPDESGRTHSRLLQTNQQSSSPQSSDRLFVNKGNTSQSMSNMQQNDSMQYEDKQQTLSDKHESLNNDRMSESQLVDEIKESFHRFKEENDNKKQIIMSYLVKADSETLIKRLLLDGEEEIAKYIFQFFAFEDKEVYNQAFMKIIEHNSIDLTQYFIKHNLVEVEEFRDEEGNSALMLAVIHGHLIISKMLITYQSELVYQENYRGFNCLLISVFNNDLLMFKLVFSNYQDDITNANELMIIAISNENTHIIKCLIERKGSGFIWDDILLHHAASQSNLDVFNLINSLKWQPTIDYNYEIKDSDPHYLTCTDENGEIPLHWGVIKGDHKVVKRLLELMLKSGLSVDYKAKNGVTAFHLACIKQDKELCHLLYDSGANVNELDNEGNSVCHLVSSIGDKEWLEYLVTKFNLNCFLKNNKGNTALVQAILAGRENVVEYYLTFTPNINWKNKLGQTCLHAAVFSQNTRLLRLVLECNPDVKGEDITGLTAYHYALMDNNSEILSMFNEFLERKSKSR